MVLWIIVAIVAIIILIPLCIRLMKVLWITNFITVYNMKLDQTQSPRDALLTFCNSTQRELLLMSWGQAR